MDILVYLPHKNDEYDVENFQRLYLELLEPFVTNAFLPYVHLLQRIFNPKVGFRWNLENSKCFSLYFHEPSHNQIFQRVIAADKLHMTPAMHVKWGIYRIDLEQ